MKDRKRWDGMTVACIASGPSLTAEDCESIRTAGLPAIVTNNTWQLAPWADVLYAGDYQWWKRYGEECTFAGSRWRSEEHTSELQSLMRISYAVFCLKKKKKNITNN